MRFGVVLAAASAAVVWSSIAGADPDAQLPVPAAPRVSAESRLNEGLVLSEKKDWYGAEKAFRDAIRLRAAFPEAWNGLGFVLRSLKQYEESIQSYKEALRLRPDYPQALEYLGEAYVQIGRLDEAKAVLDRLRPLDPAEADELAEVIARAGK